jgi:hypothetical protein
MAEQRDELIDLSMTTFEAARREQLRRWAALPLEDIIRALEEMEEITAQLHAQYNDGAPSST